MDNNEFPIIQERACGECTFCCKVLGIKELDKAPDAWCPHVKIGKGCGIYENRPQSCREFSCMWVNYKTMPEEWRPDLSKVCIWEPNNAEGNIQVNVDPARPNAWKERGIDKFLQKFAGKHNRIVAIICGGKRALIIPKDKEEEVMEKLEKIKHG